MLSKSLSTGETSYSRYLPRTSGTNIDSDKQEGPRILLAEDDNEMRSLLSWSLRREGYTVTECLDGPTLLGHLDPRLTAGSQRPFDLIITDVRMPDLSGLEVLRIIEKTAGHLPPIIIITAFGDHKLHRDAEHLGVATILDKPFEVSDLLDKASQILSATKSSSQIRALEGAELLELETFVRADLELIEPTVTRLLNEAREMGRLADKSYEIGTALREALTTAILHGCGNAPSKSIQVVMTFDPSGGTSVVVRDPDCGVAQEMVTNPRLNDNLLSGTSRGISLIRQFMDEVHFEAGGTELHMYKNG